MSDLLVAKLYKGYFNEKAPCQLARGFLIFVFFVKL